MFVTRFMATPFAFARGVSGVVRVPDPVAGLDWSATVPGGTVWRVLTVVGTFTTSAVVANRFVGLVATDGTSVIHRARASAAATASLVLNMSSSSQVGGASVAVAAGSGLFQAPPMFLPSGFTVGFETRGIDPADQWNSVLLYVEQYDTGPYGQDLGVHEVDASDLLMQ